MIAQPAKITNCRVANFVELTFEFEFQLSVTRMCTGRRVTGTRRRVHRRVTDNSNSKSQLDDYEPSELQVSSIGSFTSDEVNRIVFITALHLMSTHSHCRCDAIHCIALWRRVRMNSKTCLNWSCPIMVATGPCVFSIDV